MSGKESNGIPRRYCGLGSRPPNKEYRKKLSCNLFAGGGSCLQFIENTTPVTINKATHKKNKVCLFGIWNDRQPSVGLAISCVCVCVCVPFRDHLTFLWLSL